MILIVVSLSIGDPAEAARIGHPHAHLAAARRDRHIEWRKGNDGAQFLDQRDLLRETQCAAPQMKAADFFGIRHFSHVFVKICP